MESASLCQSQALPSLMNNRSNIINQNQFPTSCRYLRSDCYGYQQLSGGLSSKQQRFDAVGCVTWASDSAALLDELEEEEEEEEEEEWMRVGRCQERKGMVELLECLEAEAIMGEDQGREPTDYNRRAQIFDKSSRVFQALKGKPSN